MLRKLLHKSGSALLMLVFMASLLASAQVDPRTQVPHIGARAALKLFQQSKLLLIDVHTGANKPRSDIVGALYVPAYKLAELKPKAPPGVLLGIFCN